MAYLQYIKSTIYCTAIKKQQQLGPTTTAIINNNRPNNSFNFWFY